MRALQTALDALGKEIAIRVDQAPRMEGRQLFALVRVDKGARARTDKPADEKTGADGETNETDSPMVALDTPSEATGPVAVVPVVAPEPIAESAEPVATA
jgi:hypothetical protein